MVWRSSFVISSPLWRLSSMKVLKPLSHKAWYKWLVKPKRVSSPLKLKKTSCLHRRVEEEDEGRTLVSKTMVIYEQKVEKMRRSSVLGERNCKGYWVRNSQGKWRNRKESQRERIFLERVPRHLHIPVPQYMNNAILLMNSTTRFQFSRITSIRMTWKTYIYIRQRCHIRFSQIKAVTHVIITLPKHSKY